MQVGAEAGAGMRWLVIGAAALLLLAGLGNIDVWAPDEPRYVQVAEEMRSLEHGPTGLVVLHLNGATYDQKPPLYYWLAALAGAPFGRVSETLGRLPSAISGIALVALTLLFGTRLFGGRVGVLGAGMLLTVFEFARLARRVQLDILLALLETGALFLYWRIDRGIGARRPQLAWLHLLLGLAVLTKGPVGFLVPILVIATHLALERRLTDLRGLLPVWALPLSLGPGLLWIAAASALAPAGFAEDALGTNLIGRFFSGTSHARPVYYFLVQFPIDFLPWTLVWPAVFIAARRAVFADGGAPEETRRAWRFLLAWVGASLVFFSLSSGKRGLYMIPAFPAAALLCADALARILAGRVRMPRSIGALAAGFGGVLALVAVEVALAATSGRSLVLANPRFPELASLVSEAVAQTRAPLITAFGCAVVGILAASVVAWVVLARHRSTPLARVGVAVFAALGIELAVFLLLFPAIDPLRSLQPVARAAAAASPDHAPLGLVGDRAMAGGLVYYADRRVATLGTAESIRAFLDEGGGAIVVKRRKLDRVTEVTPVETIFETREGRRTLLAVRATGDGSPPGERRGDDGAPRRRDAP